MNTRQAYNTWAAQYDTNENKTRDLEANALRISLSDIPFDNCLEVGCGTGKNTVWLIGKAKYVTAVDLSEEMLAKAREKVKTNRVEFMQADITHDWSFPDQLYDLISFSLILEHIRDLNHIFREASRFLKPGGFIYIGELHPFKQYSGTKARFDTEEGRHIVECYTHHTSEFIQAAKKYQLFPIDVNEYFDNDLRDGVPRILTIILKKV
ncbi:MAG: SAM-dependent methyltransferase [Marivirga sp.]|nr:SAM-dependent methyltransferase [Marivirga sp.]